MDKDKKYRRKVRVLSHESDFPVPTNAPSWAIKQSTQTVSHNTSPPFPNFISQSPKLYHLIPTLHLNMHLPSPELYLDKQHSLPFPQTVSNPMQTVPLITSSSDSDSSDFSDSDW